MDESEQLLEVLNRAEHSVELDAMGAAAAITDACRAYQLLSQNPAALSRLEPRLLQMTREGSPAAIIYAALLLKALGREVAPLLAPYADDRRPCMVMPGGCMGVSHWLCEATRWVLGVCWSHPGRLLGSSLESLTDANWFELPSEQLLQAVREGTPRKGSMAVGRWTFVFAELLYSEQLGTVEAQLVELCAHGNPVVQIYAALLLRRLNPTASTATFNALRANHQELLELSPRFLRRRNTERVLVGELVARVEHWNPD